jgi:protein involved in polysaccharide export with SLBB domain
MIDYGKLKPGDRLRITGMGAPGFAKIGDEVEVIWTDGVKRCDVKRADGQTAYFALACGAQRLELVEDHATPAEIAATKEG